jgi:glutaredoxin
MDNVTAQPNITMYVREECTDVHRARHILQKRGLSWTEFDIDEDREALARVEDWNDGRSPTPTLWIGDVMLVEPTQAEIDEALSRFRKSDDGISLQPI